MRKKVADAASAAAVAERRKADALRVIDQLDAHQFIAAALHAQAKAAGIPVKFMPASGGVIAVEGRAGAFDDADAMIAGFPYPSREARPVRMRPAPLSCRRRDRWVGHRQRGGGGIPRSRGARRQCL